MNDVLLERQNTELELADFIAQFHDDPLQFVLGAYPWNEPGPLEHHSGPDTWQADFLTDLGKKVAANAFDGVTAVPPVRMAVASGHGVGKSVLCAWLTDWIMSTRPHSQGTVTANTFSQLETKTWAAIQYWTSLCITSHWFNIGQRKMTHKDFKSTWFCSAQTCAEENSEAFAGQHAASSTSFYVFDESSAVPDKIWEVAEGGQTDGEPMWFVFGNPTRSEGRFYRACFGSEQARWDNRSLDSRDCRFSNKTQIEEWEEFYGADSDWFRVRVLGMPPRASDSQFIDLQTIREAQRRRPVVLPNEPLIAGCDFAWGGDDLNVVRFRRGLDAYSIPPLKIPGEKTREPEVMVGRLAEVLTKDYDGQKVRVMFVDSAGIAGPVVHRLRTLGFKNVVEVNFGADAPDVKYANYRAFMWGKCKEWLAAGGIDKDPGLESNLAGPGYKITHKKTQVLLESKEDMKKRGEASPDQADALALSFAQPVALTERKAAPYVPHGAATAWS
jgi:hypothetical protein